MSPPGGLGDYSLIFTGGVVWADSKRRGLDQSRSRLYPGHTERSTGSPNVESHAGLRAVFMVFLEIPPQRPSAGRRIHSTTDPSRLGGRRPTGRGEQSQRHPVVLFGPSTVSPPRVVTCTAGLRVIHCGPNRTQLFRQRVTDSTPGSQIRKIAYVGWSVTVRSCVLSSRMHRLIPTGFSTELIHRFIHRS